MFRGEEKGSESEEKEEVIQFFHDKERDILVYENRAPFLLQALPEARLINGAYFAVPRTLRASQTLRHFNYPVPPIMTDANYDWPAMPGRKALPHQKIMANFSVLHPRMFNLSDMGCVAGETLIDTAEGPISIENLARNGKTFGVRTVTNTGIQYVEIAAPFAKGVDKLYRVSFKSGRSIVVTKRHVFLTSRGWVSCENLLVSEQLPVFDVYPQVSIWEPSHVRSQPSALHSTGTIEDFQGYSQTLFCDAPPLSVTNIDPALTPLLNDVREHIRFAWHTDAQGKKCICTAPPSVDRLSTLRCGVQIDQGEMGYFLSEFATKQTDSQFHICAQYRLFPNQHRVIPSSPELRLCIPISEASGAPFDTVTHIAYERTDVYYDMEVPEYANYIAHGLCNHNTMKTLSTLWAADYLMRQHPKGEFRALIVAPLSTLQRVWADAIFSNFLGKRTFEILHGDADRRMQSLGKEADFYIINFDGVGVGAHTRKRFELDGFSRALAEREDIKLAIVDEASAYKDATTKRHRIARIVLGKRDYLWMLTGTPTPNAPTDAYGLAKLVNNSWGKSFTTFQAETMFKVSQFKWVPQKDGYDKARALLSPSIRYDIKDVWDGPELATQQRQVELTAQQKKLLADLKRDLQVVVKSGKEITAANEAAARQKFLQISLGAIYDGNHKAHTIDAAPRINELKALIEQAPGKMLIFAGLTSVLEMLYKELKPWTREIVNGDVSQKSRSNIFQAFQSEPEPRLLIADPNCMAHGLDLYAAQTIVWYGPTDKTELYLQANKRAHRPGQRYPVTIVQMVSNPLEIEIYKRLETNTTLQGALLDMVRKGQL